MSALVIDASVVAKWYLPETDSALADTLLETDNIFHAPDLLRVEIANIFRRNVAAGRVGREAWNSAEAEVLRVVQQWHSDSDLLPDAYGIAVSVDLPIYDCLYLTLADRLRTTFLTADMRLLERIKHTQFAVLASDFKAFCR
ncbi:MAG: type II toxin-antitoxin system VapC family toxin [Beijerinckiaceae bacterium]